MLSETPAKRLRSNLMGSLALKLVLGEAHCVGSACDAGHATLTPKCNHIAITCTPIPYALEMQHLVSLVGSSTTWSRGCLRII